ncbi:hypothetical protein F0262_21300 [Vibrio rotiferianus]|uniref:Uncharacterized protein n=1 Tax=Vibrio rotiferianus TaxID=190895 RepID=A0A7Y3ZCP5_9VIBR|nr:hypothetical protein [Vibrio rotiferianus]
MYKYFPSDLLMNSPFLYSLKY